MKFLHIIAGLLGYTAALETISDNFNAPSVQVKHFSFASASSDTEPDVTYIGFHRNDVEVWLNVQYGMDTGDEERFKPPRPYIPDAGTVFYNDREGPACPQSLGQWLPPLTLGNITQTDEDCLNLNIVRPRLGTYDHPLPVMLWIHGGSFWTGSNTETTHQPDALVLESVKNGLPVIHVAINYRLGVFGFGVTDALKQEGSLNAGLRDQRLAIEWIRDRIEYWGGDPKNITIFGQSSGGLAVGLQLLAYGGTKPIPFTRGICESQALEPGITGNFSIEAMARVAREVRCNATDLHDPKTIKCLRGIPTDTLFNASLTTYFGDINHNIGDIWLPAVDGDFLPAPPSQLIKEGRFSKANYMIGWTDGDVNFFTNFSIATAQDTFDFVQGYLPAMPREVVEELLNLYPVAEFLPPAGTNLTAEFYRSARIFRDILMVCQPISLAEGIHNKDQRNLVFLYHWNQTILDPILAQVYNVSHMGVVHTSEFAYTYANFSHWNISNYPLNLTEADYTLQTRASRSWSQFANLGYVSVEGEDPHQVLQFWPDAFSIHNETTNNTGVYVIGGPREGLSTFDGEMATQEFESQKLRERCGFINSDRIIPYLQY